jgi:hypothetical protein
MVSLRPKKQVIQTAYLRKQGDRLFVNADVSEGQLLVEVVNEARQVIPGYGKNECVPLRGSGVHQPVTWNQQKNLPEGSVSLKFYLTKGDIYSYVIS